MQLSIIIVSYNTAALTIQTLESILAELQHTPALKEMLEIIVVDNNSHDDSVALLKTLSKERSATIKIIENSTNSGFAQANNQALKIARGEFLLLLNSDTIVQPGALNQLLTSFENNPVFDFSAVSESGRGQLDKLGVLAATLLNPDGSIQAQGGQFPSLFSLASHMLLLDDLPIVGQFFPSTQHTGRNTHAVHQPGLQQQDWVGGTALMIRRQVLDEIGPLDENIFMYGEDIEFCMRARDHHWDIAIDPQAQIVHFGSASSSSKNAIIGEALGYLYIWSKHKPLWQRPLAKKLLQLGSLLRVWLFGTMVKQPTKVAIYKELFQQLAKA